MKDIQALLHRSLLWTGLQHWGIHAIKFAVLLLLARIITPASFGTFALAASVVAVAQLFSGQGMLVALVQRHQLEEEHRGTAFLSMLIWSLLLTGALTLGAHSLVKIFARAQITSRIDVVIRVLAWSLPLNAISGICISLWRRDLAYKRVALVTTASQLGGSVVAVLLAVRGAGIWSLVARQLVEALIMAILCISSAPWRLLPRSTWNRYRELMQVAAPVAGTNLMIFTRTRVDEMLIGFWLGAEALGFYSIARRQIDAISALVPTVIGNAFSPILSRLQKDESRLRFVIEQGHLLFGVIVLPVFAAIAVTAGDWLPLVLGQRWTPAVPILQAFAFIAALTTLLNFNLSVLLATGRPRARLVLEGIMTAVLLIAAVAALPWGTTGVARASELAVAIFVPLELAWIARRIPLTARKQFRILSPALLGVLALVVVLTALRLALLHTFGPAWRFCILAGTAVFFILAALHRSRPLSRAVEARDAFLSSPV